MARPCVFLDKDGTLIHGVSFNRNPDLFHLEPGALEALRKLDQAGYALVVVANHPGVARGFYSEIDLARPLPVPGAPRATPRVTGVWL